MPETVLFEQRDAVALVALNRPHKLNALSYELIDDLLGLLDRIEAEDAVRVVILTGAGDRAFSAGADIRQFSRSVAEGPDAALRGFVRRGQGLTSRIEAFHKPIIAAVNGIAVGGGCEIVEAAHLAIASELAVFGKPEIRIGMPPTFGGTQRLPRIAGRKRAIEHLLTGDTFTAARALDLGLVNAVAQPLELMSAAFALADRIARQSPLAVARIIAAVTRGLDGPVGAGLAVEAEQFARMVPTHDLTEGLGAWIERRPPVFVGR